jgi:hypothetical protein
MTTTAQIFDPTDDYLKPRLQGYRSAQEQTHRAEMAKAEITRHCAELEALRNRNA